MNDQWTTLQESLNVLEPLSDPYVGIIKKEYGKLRDVDDILLHSYGAQCTDTTLIFGNPANTYNGGGSEDPLSARLASLGETVERYSAAFLPKYSDLVCYGSENELKKMGKQVIGHDKWELYADEQYLQDHFPHQRWTADTKLWWRKGINETLCSEIWSPAQLIHISSYSDWPGDPNISHSTSNGLACGITYTEAALSGLFECIERDAFMLTWYNKLSLPHIDIASSRRLTNFYKKHIQPTYLDIHLIDMTIFSGVPTVLSVIRNRHSKTAPFAIGAASSYSIERACEKAAIESMYTRTWAKTEQRLGNALENIDYNEDINSFEDHIKLYAGTKLIEAADFLTQNTKKIDVKNFKSFDDKSPKALWKNLITHFNDMGYEITTYDLTSPDIKEAGAYVVKSFIPGYKPIDVLYRARMLGGERILNLSYKLGLVDKPFASINELNQTPHPFP
ncbi:YcaO-like family protein [Staphylococcus pseudintermedius]|uniref:YcaO-like family protein n=1 Tax=Staphylococcus pseudintermedius TaxID=283734 RepID=UPI0035C07B74